MTNTHVSDQLAGQMYQDYMRLGSLRLVAELYGRGRQNVHRIFKRRGWERLAQDSWRPERLRKSREVEMATIRCESCGQVSVHPVGDPCGWCR